VGSNPTRRGATCSGKPPALPGDSARLGRCGVLSAILCLACACSASESARETGPSELRQQNVLVMDDGFDLSLPLFEGRISGRYTVVCTCGSGSGTGDGVAPDLVNAKEGSVIDGPFPSAMDVSSRCPSIASGQASRGSSWLFRRSGCLLGIGSVIDGPFPSAMDVSSRCPSIASGQASRGSSWLFRRSGCLLGMGNDGFHADIDLPALRSGSGLNLQTGDSLLQ
jgi:hypothetical protein